MSAIEALIKQVIIQAPWMDTTPAQVELTTLLEYADHKDECEKYFSSSYKCTCGLEQFLERFRKEGER